MVGHGIYYVCSCTCKENSCRYKISPDLAQSVTAIRNDGTNMQCLLYRLADYYFFNDSLMSTGNPMLHASFTLTLIVAALMILFTCTYTCKSLRQKMQDFQYLYITGCLRLKACCWTMCCGLLCHWWIVHNWVISCVRKSSFRLESQRQCLQAQALKKE